MVNSVSLQFYLCRLVAVSVIWAARIFLFFLALYVLCGIGFLPAII